MGIADAMDKAAGILDAVTVAGKAIDLPVLNVVFQVAAGGYIMAILFRSQCTWLLWEFTGTAHVIIISIPAVCPTIVFIILFFTSTIRWHRWALLMLWIKLLVS